MRTFDADQTELVPPGCAHSDADQTELVPPSWGIAVGLGGRLIVAAAGIIDDGFELRRQGIDRNQAELVRGLSADAAGSIQLLGPRRMGSNF